MALHKSNNCDSIYLAAHTGNTQKSNPIRCSSFAHYATILLPFNKEYSKFWMQTIGHITIDTDVDTG